MISSGAFNYINVLDKAADASWLRETAITNNLANADTPGYKRKDVNFEGLLKSELGMWRYKPLDQKVSEVHLDHLNATTYTDASNYSYRLDDNNVDPDTEEVELASERIRYSALTDSISQEIARFKSVLG